MEGTKIDKRVCITFAKVLQVVLSPFVYLLRTEESRDNTEHHAS